MRISGLFRIVSMLALCLTPILASAQSKFELNNPPILEEIYQRDADIIRYRNLHYWAGLVEEYYEKTGHYPLQELDPPPEAGVLVRIAQQQHRQYYLHDNANYNYLLDFNQNGYFQNVHVISLIRVLEKGLSRQIDERYDIQNVPTDFPTWIHYYAMPNGYLMWTACAVCADSNITFRVGEETKALNTINVGSAEIAKDHPKFFTYDELVSSPTFMSLLKRPLGKEDYVETLWLGMSRQWQDAFAQ